MSPLTSIERPTETVLLDRGLVEYRYEGHGEATVLIFHGGHMRAALALGEDVFAEAGYSILVPSRPGYGRTPLSTGGSVDGFAEATRELCEHLSITKIAAVVGISAGGRTALKMAASNRNLVDKVILQSSVGSIPWPDRRTRVAAHIAFTSITERMTWSIVRMIMQTAPDLGLRLLLGDLSTQPFRVVLRALSVEDRTKLISLFACMRSGGGFLNDLTSLPDAASEVIQPALVIASRSDGAVPFAHAELLTATLENSTLIESKAESHFIWFGHDWPTIATRIRAFMATSPARSAYDRDVEEF